MAKNDKKDAGFIETLLQMPDPLQTRFLKLIAATAITCILSITLMIVLKTPFLILGLALAVILAALAMDIVWSYEKGKFICQKVVIIKANYFLKKNQLHLIVRECNAENQETIHQFFIGGQKNELSLLTPNTVLNIYYKSNDKTNLVAWEILDYEGN